MALDRLGGPGKVLRQVAAFIALGVAAGQGVQAAPGCETVTGVLACQNLGPFLASATRVTLSRKDGPTAYVGVRTTVRFQNVSDRPLILAYRVGSQKVTDDKGLVYNWNRGSYELKSIAGIASSRATAPTRSSCWRRARPATRRSKAFSSTRCGARSRAMPTTTT